MNLHEIRTKIRDLTSLIEEAHLKGIKNYITDQYKACRNDLQKQLRKLNEKTSYNQTDQ